MNWSQIELKWVAMTQRLCGEWPGSRNDDAIEAKSLRASKPDRKLPFAVDRKDRVEAESEVQQTVPRH